MISTEDKQKIESAIAQAELACSGEIRVHFDEKCKEEVLERAAKVFDELKMHKTELRNGVLFYIALEDHKFAILGDQGINSKTPDNFWDQIKEAMLIHLKKENVAEALKTGIEMAGRALAEHFPYQDDDINELSNDISFEK